MRETQLPIAGIRVAIRKLPSSQYIREQFVTAIMPGTASYGQRRATAMAFGGSEPANKRHSAVRPKLTVLNRQKPAFRLKSTPCPMNTAIVSYQ
jgi:hypothetical protein